VGFSVSAADVDAFADTNRIQRQAFGVVVVEKKTGYDIANEYGLTDLGGSPPKSKEGENSGLFIV
jgi:hypothetical protein